MPMDTNQPWPLASCRFLFHVTPAPLLAEALADLLRTVDRPGSFYTAGTAELLPLSLEIEEIGLVALRCCPCGPGS